MAPNLLQTSLLLLCVCISISEASPAIVPRAVAILPRAVLVPTILPATWSYKGCYTDNVASRSLTGANYANGTSMTDETCMAFCLGNGFVYAGTEYSAECYCGNSIQSSSTKVIDSDCNMACSANETEACGGSSRLTVFFSTYTPPPGPSVDPGVGLWSSLGCYNDSIDFRTLAVGTATLGSFGNLTIANCVSACQAGNYKYAGVEYAQQCYCDNSIASTGGPAPDGAVGCNMACTGNSSELCGGSNRLNMYEFNMTHPNPVSTSSKSQSSSSTPSTSSKLTSTSAPPVATSSAQDGSPSLTSSSTKVMPSPSSSSSAPVVTNWLSLGCYTDTVDVRSLSIGMAVPGGADAMTIEACTVACKAGGYILAGVEYASQCYCDNSIKNNANVAPDGDAGCNMPCSGNANEVCGGSNRLNVYRYAAAGVSTSGSPAATTSSSPTTTSKGATGTGSPGSATNLPAGWTYDGCYVDNLAGRILNFAQPDSSTVTIESCISTCVGLGYTVVGLEYSTQCFCDGFIRNGGTSSAESDCAMTCGGASNEICGGPNRMSIYSTGPLTIYQPPTILPTYSGWKYQGCLTDGNTALRTLPYKLVFPGTNSPSVCLDQCKKFGYDAGGMEYGEECYCGDVSDPSTAGAATAPDTDCNMNCPGNATALCGAGNRLAFYTWTGTPLQTYGYPSGYLAGEYQYLVTSPVIPLITTMGHNGKVTIVEKFGTSLTEGSTGAYELDPSDNSFRTMHVQTDVFCSAGLTLPDKVARQINIGGWSLDSTYGIRFYWPDGSPGVPGVNDWQEDFHEIELQRGRWYPTAMILSNGTILVVGGEEGSNGAAVPSIELLPKVGGVLTMDWLQETDPYNLYPFLCMLPSGGVFVAYFNQARILDEITFATTKILPGIPGAVNADVEQVGSIYDVPGGRTYPLEGTMVLLPQHAPYTDPLTVLICGGGTPFGGPAIDNCVSTQPEAANPTWTIEKMPSQRVMSCMAALPDGTYLILNGAKVGIAGFGLANTPNHNAILYDPTKPINQRMSIMANTTIDRFYHSEAILLQDGRVLVSGSDPQTPGLLQEYRLEVFVPPYLLSGAARPSFTITNTDWTYGAAISVTISTPGAGATRFSLMGAESSTHGNSMGQRTIFPAFTCAGATCTITAPPNSHVCPPGWFQLFVLDGPTPSTSKWVRIGGDPGNLGSWPSGFTDFTVPGEKM